MALVAVPGLGLSRTDWETTLRQLRPRPSRTVLLPGYGEPAQRHQALDPASSARRLLDHLAEVEGPVVLLAHSASCQVVAEAAAANHGRVVGVVLVGPTTDPRARSWVGLAERWLRTAVHERPGEVPVLVRSYLRTGLGVIARTMDATRCQPIGVPLARVRPPVLVVRGRRDRICPRDWAERLASLAPEGSRVVTLPVGAHMVPLTHGALVADAVAAYLRSLGAELSGA